MILVFDIGGTHMRVATSVDGTTLNEPVVLDTPGGFEEGVQLLADAAQKCCNGETVSRAVGGVRGVLDATHETITSDAHLTGWVGKPLKRVLEDALNTKVYLENDTALVGLGEATVGAGAGQRLVAYVTVSTGIGGVRIVDAAIDQNARGFEPGKQILDWQRGTTLEAYASGGAFEAKYKIHPKDVTDVDAWETFADTLAVGLHNTIVHWSPDVLVLGGPMILRPLPGYYEKTVERTRTLLAETNYAPPNIVPATLGDYGGLHGALGCAKEMRKYEKRT